MLWLLVLELSSPIMIAKVLALLFTCGLILQLNYIYFNKCSTKHIGEVCSLVKKSPYESEFCQKLCNSEIYFLKCHSVGYIKSVHEVIINGQHLVLKSRHTRNSQELQLDVSGELHTFIKWNSSKWIVNYFGHCKDIYATEPVQQTAGQIFGNDESLIELLPDLPEPFSAIIDTISTQLLRFSAVRNLALFAKITEKRLVKFISHMLSQNQPSFEQRIHFARSLFLMLEDMHISSGGTIIMCDVHIDNFGYTKSGRVKIIDADDIYVIKEASSKVSERICNADVDCTIGDYSDCHSKCDHKTRTCSSSLALSNVRNICNVLLNIVFNELTTEEFKTVDKAMGEFSNSDAVSVDDEIYRIRKLLNLLNDIKI